MIDEPRVLPECEGDTTLVNFLLDQNTNHQKSIFKVEKSLMNCSSKKLGIGVVDNEKREPPYFSNFKVQKEAYGLKMKHYPNTRQYLIVVNPAMEKWLIHCADHLNKINPKFERFTKFDTLRRLTKRQAVQQDKDFKDFLNTLWQQEVKPIITLQEWLEEILKKG
jgi:hypothetical protein